MVHIIQILQVGKLDSFIIENASKSNDKFSNRLLRVCAKDVCIQIFQANCTLCKNLSSQCYIAEKQCLLDQFNI